MTSRRIGDGAEPVRPVLATLDERLGVLARQGYRVTPQRAAILAGLHGTGKMNATAEEICRQARMLCPTVNLATTYRTLDLFGRLGIIRRVTTGDGGSVFCSNPQPHYHGTCIRCGAVVDLPWGGVEESVTRGVAELRDGRFDVVGHHIEFYGYCASCRVVAPVGASAP